MESLPSFTAPQIPSSSTTDQTENQANDGTAIDPTDEDDDKLHILLFFSRHGERADKKFGMAVLSNLISCDPYLTEDGKMEAYDVGKKMYAYIE
jgi:hypothetical protein